MKNRYQDIIKDLSEKELLLHLYATQIILLTISFILGIIFFKDILFFVHLFRWDDAAVYTVGITGGLLVVLVDLLLMRFLPKTYYDDGGLNEKIFRNKSILQISFIAALVAFSEELLFRGVIQTKLGLVIASIVFAIIHFRYLFNWFLLLNIVCLSFFIGFLYYWTNNLAVTFTMHFIVDFVLGYFLMKKSQKIGSDHS